MNTEIRYNQQDPKIKPQVLPLFDKQELINQLEALLAPYAALKKSQDPDLTALLPNIKQAIAEASLEHTRGNQSKAARLLGIHRATLKGLYTGIKKQVN